MTAGGNVAAMKKAIDPETHKTKRARLTDHERALRAIKEVDLETSVYDSAKTFNWQYVHFRAARTAHGWVTPFTGDGGFPDCVIAKGTRLIFAELKRETEEPEPEQVFWLNLLASIPGVEVYLWKPRDLNSGEIDRILSLGPTDRDVSRWVV